MPSPPSPSSPERLLPYPAAPFAFAALDPQAVLDALDAVGLRGDGRLLQLNSYENRVFQVYLEDERVVVAKFYRPGRWSDEQILEEHAFALELADAEVPAVPPLVIGSQTLFHVELGGVHHRFAVSERRSGRAPELDDPETLEWIGRFIGRLHEIGHRSHFQHRRRLDVDTFGRRSRSLLVEGDFVPPSQRDSWQRACDDALDLVACRFKDCEHTATLRLHGDCHPGNLLWREQDGPHFVDLDDACTGPAVQDLWMLLSGEREMARRQLLCLLDGYRAFMAFDARELVLIEPLRTLRMLHHSAWIAERWTDPAFPAAFPWFGSEAYWSQQASQLREQIDAMHDDPLIAASSPLWL